MKIRIIPFLLAVISIIILQNLAIKSAFAEEIYYVKIDGIVNPVMAEFLGRTLDEANAGGALALVIELDTPGGLDLSMREIVKDMFASGIPVIVYVAPAGSRAASAGVFLTYAANVAAMAPGTNIGSAHPVAMGGGKMDETMVRKVENDAVAYIKGIASKRGRNAEWAEAAVRQSVNITAEEALKKNVINIIASDRTELLDKLDGMKVETSAGIRELKTKSATVKDVEMGLRFKILDRISDPNIAYILMMIGLIGIYFELSNPGAVLPGVIGALCLVLAFYAFQTLPINYAGLLLIGLGIIFFIVELKVVSYGLLTVAGIVSLVLGSLMLFDTPNPAMRLSIWVILPTVVLFVAVILGTMYYALRIFRKKPVSGTEQLIGDEGVASMDFKAGEEGKVFIEGEYWNAVAEGPIQKNDKIVVLEVKGLLLKIAKKQ